MCTFLKKEAVIYLREHDHLQLEVAGYAGIRIVSMKTAMDRNSRSLATYRAVIRLAQEMNKHPEEIIEELKP